MTVGFYVDYGRSDECLSALQLVSFLEERGVRVEIYPAGRAAQLNSRWDARVCRNPKGSFVDWVAGLSHVVFCDWPSAEVLSAAKSAGAKVYLLCSWLSLTKGNLPTLKEFDRVVCPSKAVTRLVRSVAPKGTSVAALPWSLVVPLTRSKHVTDPKRTGVVWSLDGTQPLYQTPEILPAVRAVVGFPHVYLTVLYTSRLPDDVLTDLKLLVSEVDGRVALVKNPSWERRLLTTAAHDLSICPALVDNFGLPVLEALVCGTAVAAFDHPTAGELVKNTVAGALVPCDLRFNELDVPSVVPDTGAFRDAVIKLVNDPAGLDRLRAGTHHKLAERREFFETVAATLFNL